MCLCPEQTAFQWERQSSCKKKRVWSSNKKALPKYKSSKKHKVEGAKSACKGFTVEGTFELDLNVLTLKMKSRCS
jgi:hypothetical protein